MLQRQPSVRSTAGYSSGQSDLSECDLEGDILDVNGPYDQVWTHCLSQCGFKMIALVLGGGITLLFTVVISCDINGVLTNVEPDYSATYVIIIAPYVSCNLSLGEAARTLYEGVLINFPSLHAPQIDLSCWQAGSMAQAVIGMGLNGSLLFLDAALRDTLPRALLLAAALKQRAAVVVVNHALAQSLGGHSWVRLLQEAQPPNVRWASVGNNLLDNQLVKDISCEGKSNCGCSDPHTGYVDCLAGVFNLATLTLHDRMELLRHTIHRGEIAGIRKLPALAFTNTMAIEAPWANVWSRRVNVSQMRMMVDCGGINVSGGSLERPVMEEAMLNRLFAGIDSYHAANPFGLRVNTTTFNCEDIRVNVLHRGRLEPAQLLDTLASFDIYVPVDSDPVSYATTVPQAQMAGVAVLSLGTDHYSSLRGHGVPYSAVQLELGTELLDTGVTGFMPKTKGDIQRALGNIERDVASNKLRRRIHASAKRRFSARRALQHVLLGLFPELKWVHRVKLYR